MANLHHEHKHSNLYIERFYTQGGGANRKHYRIVVQKQPSKPDFYLVEFFTWSDTNGWLFLVDEFVTSPDLEYVFSFTLEHSLDYL